MPKKTVDPFKAVVRRSKAERKNGTSLKCTRCDESRIEALVPRTNPRLCVECHREQSGKRVTDKHHLAGKANSAITLEIGANDHRAVLSTQQYKWPAATLQNRDESPLLRAAAVLRGIADLFGELFARLVEECSMFLETLDEVLDELLGVGWWRTTIVASWKPR